MTILATILGWGMSIIILLLGILGGCTAIYNGVKECIDKYRKTYKNASYVLGIGLVLVGLLIMLICVTVFCCANPIVSSILAVI